MAAPPLAGTLSRASTAPQLPQQLRGSRLGRQRSAVQRRRHQTRGPRLEVRDRVVVENDAVLGTNLDFGAVPPRPALCPQLEISHRNRLILDRDAVGLQKFP